MVALGGVWLLWGGMHGCSKGGTHGCSRGACVVALEGGVRGFFDEIRSMSGRYASYWNAFLLDLYFSSVLVSKLTCNNSSLRPAP